MDVFIWAMFILGVLGYFSDDGYHIVSGAILMVAAASIAYFDHHHYQTPYYSVQEPNETTEVQNIE